MNNSTKKEIRRVVHWLNGLSVLILLLIVWGALVRLTGSGLSIPDWPVINGSLLPPMSEIAWEAAMDDYVAEALSLNDPRFPVRLATSEFRGMFWIEYIHRSLAALSGFVFLFIAFLTFRKQHLRQKIGVHLIILFLLLISQAVMGGVVVMTALPGLLIAIHLVMALLFFGGLIWTALTLTRQEPRVGTSLSAGYNPILLVWTTMGLLLLQMFIGGLIAGIGRDQIVSSWPLMMGAFTPPSAVMWSSNFAGLENLVANSVLLQFIHRWLAFVLFAVFIVLKVKTKATPFLSRTRSAFKFASAMFGIQILIGIFNVMYAAPTTISATHSAAGAALFASLVILLHDLRFGVVDASA